MTQLAFWKSETKPATPLVNVAQVPQRSPFRYPGGKTWLVPHVRAWLRSLPKKPQVFVEPFAGGGIINAGASLKLSDHLRANIEVFGILQRYIYYHTIAGYLAPSASLSWRFDND